MGNVGLYQAWSRNFKPGGKHCQQIIQGLFILLTVIPKQFLLSLMRLLRAYGPRKDN